MHATDNPPQRPVHMSSSPPRSTTPNEQEASSEWTVHISTTTQKREICKRCERPKPRTCICAALPDCPISLQNCMLLVLQHPHETKHKNRSLPLVELCLERTSKNSSSLDSDGATAISECDMHTVVARRFGSKPDRVVQTLMNDPSRDVLLIYPSEDAVSLKEGIAKIHARRQARASSSSKIVVVLLDATWKFAKELHQANVKMAQYPSDMVSVALKPEDWIVLGDAMHCGDVATPTPPFQARRFDIRTPPSPNHLSTAECIAWILCLLEKDWSIHATLMKPLDLMVEQWHSFSSLSRDGIHKKRSHTNTNNGGTMEDPATARRKGTKAISKLWVDIK